jgi:hypothetical protein
MPTRVTSFLGNLLLYLFCIVTQGLINNLKLFFFPTPEVGRMNTETVVGKHGVVWLLPEFVLKIIYAHLFIFQVTLKLMVSQ